MYHHDNRHSRGFGFVLFRNGASVNDVIQKGPHVINGKTVILPPSLHAQVDVKKAYPRDDVQQQSPAETSTEPARLSRGTPRDTPRDQSRDHSRDHSRDISRDLSRDISRDTPRGKARLQPFDSSQSPSEDFARCARTRPLTPSAREALPLEFFDEEDNNPLPSTYTHGGYASGAPGYGLLRPEYSRFDLLYPNTPLSPQGPVDYLHDVHEPAGLFVSDHAFGRLDAPWGAMPRDAYAPGFFLDNRLDSRLDNRLDNRLDSHLDSRSPVGVWRGGHA